MTTIATEDEKRLTFVHNLLENDLKFKVSSITTLGRAFNNYAWTAAVSLDRSKSLGKVESPQPGTTAIPSDITKVVVRIGNPAAALDESVRSQNEVAAIQLSRDACSTYPRKIIPDVYGWRNRGISSAYGWIVEEFMPGEQLSLFFADLPPAAQQDLLNQMARIYKCITSYQLPSSIRGFGGLGYDEKGDVVVGPIVFGLGGPWASYDEMYEKTMDKQLALADGSPLFGGWRQGDLRERLDRFRSQGMGKVLAKVTNKAPTLVHGDFDLINMMFDPATNTITALLDFDFAHIAGPADELFYSFAEIRGLVGPLFEDTGDVSELRLFLTGEVDLPLPVPIPAYSEPLYTGEAPLAKPAKVQSKVDQSDKTKVMWDLAAKWNTALVTAGATRPRDIDGIQDLAGLYWFIQEVCSPFMLMPRWLARFNEQERLKKVADVEKRLVKCLEYWGY